MHRKALLATAFLSLSVAPVRVFAAEALPATDLIKLPLEELMGVEVTSPGKRPQRIGDTASAIFVLSNDDIVRSGASTIPDLLRLIPGVAVAQINANTWAISARGFNSRFANKLLVLMDGRTIYSPLFSGVFWDRQDTDIEDIDRIEVIRGPGATLWGANAVNGVINIITKSAKETHGAMVSAAAGSSNKADVTAREGFVLGDNASMRIYAKYFDRAANLTTAGQPGGDSWRYGRVGFRADGTVDAANTWTAEGEYYDGRIGETFLTPVYTPPYSTITRTKDNSYGGHLLGQWQHTFAPGSDLIISAYYDHSHFSDPRVSETRDTADVSFEHIVKLGAGNDLVWGGGYRITHDTLLGSPALFFTPASASTSLVNAFAEDTLTVVPSALFLTLGSKIEYNSYTDFEIEPSARLLWTPTQAQSLWGAVSRATRTPSRAEEDVQLLSAVLPPRSGINPSPLPLGLQLTGMHNLTSEDLIAYEVGYRAQITPAASVDVTVFYNDYRHLEGGYTASTPTIVLTPPPHVISTFSSANTGAGHTQGVELFASWRILPRWRIQGSATILRMHTATTGNGPNPRQQYQARSSFDLSDALSLDAGWRWVGSLPTLAVPSYGEMNARFAWRITPTIEASVVGENLLHARHLEFGSDSLPTVPTQAPRSVTAKIVARF